MGVGPVDVVIVGFPGNKFTGRIAPALMELVDSGTIRVIDLLFVMNIRNMTMRRTALTPTNLRKKSPTQRPTDSDKGGCLLSRTRTPLASPTPPPSPFGANR